VKSFGLIILFYVVSLTQVCAAVNVFFLWRESNDQSAYPIIETYIENSSDKDIEFEKVWINGQEAKGGSREYCWVQCYPKSIAKPGETLLVQVCLMTPPGYLYDAKKIEVKLKGIDEKVSGAVPRYWGYIDGSRITSVKYSRDFKNIYVAFSTWQYPSKPLKIWINQVEYTDVMNLMEVPLFPDRKPASDCYCPPGMISIPLKKALKPGQAVAIRVELEEKKIMATVIRASFGVFTDAFGVSLGEGALRKELGLDLEPFAEVIDQDIACNVLKAGQQGKGMFVQSLSDERLKRLNAGDPRLCYPYLCTASQGSSQDPLYGYLCDGMAMARYKLTPCDLPTYIELEE